MKRTLALILSLVMCLGLLAGCGDSRPAETVRLVTYNAGTFNKYIADDYPLVAEMIGRPFGRSAT